MKFRTFFTSILIVIVLVLVIFEYRDYFSDSGGVGYAAGKREVSLTQWVGKSIENGKEVAEVIDFINSESVVIKDLDAGRIFIYRYDFNKVEGEGKIYTEDRETVLGLIGMMGEEKFKKEYGYMLLNFGVGENELSLDGKKFTKIDYEGVKRIEGYYRGSEGNNEN